MAKQKSKGKISITFTAIIWVGLLLTVFGALVAALGLGGVTTFSFKWKDVVELNSTSIGLIVMAGGILLTLYQANHLPKGSQVLMKTLMGK
jgi:TRAP-type C4-dicarboxylate transport system permease small subunit